MKKFLSTVVLFFVFAAPIFAQNIAKIGYSETGIASYYFDDRNGAMTRHGEAYRMDFMEAAHRNIAFGTVVRVTNLDNNKSAYLRINDRPYTHKRVMDMSLRAAEVLEMAGRKPSVKVKIEIVALDVARNSTGIYDKFGTAAPASGSGKVVIGTPQPSGTKMKTVHTYSPAGQTVFPKGFGVQTGGFAEPNIAVSEAKRLNKKFGGKPAFVQVGWSKGKVLYRVLIGEFADKAAAERFAATVRKAKQDCFAAAHFK